MRLMVMERTPLRKQPALTAEILSLLERGEIVTAHDRTVEWFEVSTHDGKMGWVLAIACAPAPRQPPDIEPDIARLAAMRRQAAATPIAAPQPQALEAAPEADSEADDEETFLDARSADDDAVDDSDDDGGGGGGGGATSIESSWDKDSGGGGVSGGHTMPSFDHFSPHREACPSAAEALDELSLAASDTVDVSVFGPQTVRAGRGCLVQVFMHTLDQGPAAAALAKETDPASGRRGVKTLATEIARGTRVQVIFEGRGLSADEAMQELIWRGEPDACQFTVGAPADAAGKTFYPRILVLVNSVPVGAVTFALPATADAPAQSTVIRGDEARRYSYAFLSYSSRDRAEVLKRAQGLRAARIDFFQDLLSLEPGDEWAPRLNQEIDRCDLFLLFWSSHAKQSQWVMKEVEYALARRKSSSGGIPDITPVIIEGPPPPSPPDSLKDIHFNDALIYVLAAVEAEAQAPKPA